MGALPQVYLSREKRPGYDTHRKAGAMNALLRASALITNAPYICFMDCDTYVNNANGVKEVRPHLSEQTGLPASLEHANVGRFLLVFGVCLAAGS